MVVLSVGVLGVLQATLLAARLEARSAAITAGTLLAQNRLERIGALGWESAVAGLAQGPLPEGCGLAGVFPQETVESRGSRFLVVFEREPVPAEPPLCTVSCYWEAPRGGFDPRSAVRLSVRRRR
jgi:hypothetical protein